jgi:hypothetical protein
MNSAHIKSTTYVYLYTYLFIYLAFPVFTIPDQQRLECSSSTISHFNKKNTLRAQRRSEISVCIKRLSKLHVNNYTI